MLRDLEAFLRYVTLIAVRFYLLNYLHLFSVISFARSKAYYFLWAIEVCFWNGNTIASNYYSTFCVRWVAIYVLGRIQYKVLSLRSTKLSKLDPFKCPFFLSLTFNRSIRAPYYLAPSFQEESSYLVSCLTDFSIILLLLSGYLVIVCTSLNTVYYHYYTICFTL